MTNGQNEQFCLFSSLPKRVKGKPAPQMRTKIQLAQKVAAEPRKYVTNCEPRAALENSPSTSHEPDSPLISDQAVAKRYSVSRPTIWRWTKAVEGFPQPIKLTGGTTRWKLADLQAFDRRKLQNPSQQRHNTCKARTK